MKRFQIIVAAITLSLSLSMIGFAQTTQGSRTSTVGTNTTSSVGTITGSKVGTITESQTGNIGGLGMRAGNISGLRGVSIEHAWLLTRLLIVIVSFRPVS
ncbi:MAG TPA: hypothetical protein VIX17_08290 [Pyrinomonadaceae bacterium]|jgi:hypothetical protein